jgi:hypothetical protein
MVPSQPTGISTEASGNKITVRWIKNPEPDVRGYNVYNSTTSGGGLSGYIKLNNELITDYEKLQQILTNPVTTVQIVGPQKITTTTEDVSLVYVFAYIHSSLLDTSMQYYVVTAVNNSDEESQYSIEVHDVPLILSTKIVEFAIRSSNDVARSMISTILDRQPNVDVKPGTMTRDLHIDPHASEFGHFYVYADFVSRSQSFITLIQIDDPNDTGESIAVADSSYKQSLKLAMQATTDQQVQDLIDLAFDKLANNYGTFREGSTASIGTVVFYTATKPTETITVPSGTVVSTTATSTQAAINFTTTEEVKMLIASINLYYNSATQRYEVVAPIMSIDTGLMTVVNVNTIVNSTFSQLRVTNVAPTEGGRDRESNESLADRAMLAFTSVDVGTKDGYLRTAIDTQFVEDVLVVDAGHELMQRDYDPVRRRHLFGKVDIYIKGDVEVSHTESFGFLYNGLYRETESILDAVDMRIGIVNPDVSSTYPVYLIQEVINITRVAEYDLTGNFTVYKNAVEMSKLTYSLTLLDGSIQFDTALSTGDSISADYQYKIAITGEVVLASAAGGETFVILDAPSILFKPVSIFTDKIYLIRSNSFSIDPGTDRLTIFPQHVYKTGDVVRISATGAMPSPLVINTDYYVIWISNTQIKLASTLDKALSGTAIDILSSGIGVLTIRPSTSVTLLRDTDYTINLTTGQVNFSFAKFPAGLLSGDAITADYDYVETVTGEVVIASAAGGETTASLTNGRVIEALMIETGGMIINLNQANAINSSIGMAITDIVRISYRYRKATEVVLMSQPVERIISVVTDLSETLVEDTHYQFNKVDDLLLEGNSVNAVRGITMTYDSATELPSGSLLANEDSVSLPGLEYKNLTQKGIDKNTVVVQDLTRTITYVLNVDYELKDAPSAFEYLSIARSPSSSISDGQTVLVVYNYGELMTVTYGVNSLVKTVQDKVNIKRNITADVLVKGANQIDVDLEFTVRLKSGATSPVVIDEVSTNLYSLFNRKKLGQRVNQSDVIRIVDENSGVDYVILPMTRMAVSDGTHIAYEALPSNTLWSIYQVGVVTSYKTIANTLVYKTAGSDSDATRFWRVSEDDMDLQLVNSIGDVDGAAGRAFIASDGSVYISTVDGDDPSSHEITVAYNVLGEIGTNDIVATDLDYMNLKSLIVHTIA